MPRNEMSRYYRKKLQVETQAAFERGIQSAALCRRLIDTFPGIMQPFLSHPNAVVRDQVADILTEFTELTNALGPEEGEDA